MNTNSKKGFFFVFVVFLVISYMLASISITVKQIDLSEKRFAERFKNSNIELVMSQVNDKKINEVANSITYAMLFKLNERSIEFPIKSGSETAPEEEQLLFFRSAMHELVANGTASGDNFDGDQPFTSGVASFSEWVTGLNDTLQNIGFEVSEFSLNTFWINQSKIDAVDYNFTIHLKVSEKGGFTTITRDYNISSSLPIRALTDPSLAREIKGDKPDLSVEKQFYFYDGYTAPSVLTPNSEGSGSEGQGWFYGYLISVKDALSVQPFEQSKYILVGNYTDITSLGSTPDFSYSSFGAYIVTDLPIETPVSGCPGDFNQDNTFNPIKYDTSNSRCTVIANPSNYIDKPFAVDDSFDLSSAPLCDSDSSGNDRRCILFVAQKTPAEVKSAPLTKKNTVSEYDIEKLRDFAMCNYYMHTDTAPSYLQRMLVNSYSRESIFGIESFVLGNFIGGTVNDDGSARSSDTTYSDDRSRLDNEFVNSQTGFKIRGMPGCKDATTCADNSETLLGHFRLTSDSAKKYVGSSSSDITCNTGASCG